MMATYEKTFKTNVLELAENYYDAKNKRSVNN